MYRFQINDLYFDNILTDDLQRIAKRPPTDCYVHCRPNYSDVLQLTYP